MIQIKVKDLSFSYSGFRALQDISFEAGAGDMLAILGEKYSPEMYQPDIENQYRPYRNREYFPLSPFCVETLQDSRLYSPINRLDQRDQCVRYGTIGT